MEIVSEGSLESISRPASCDNVKANRDPRLSQKHGQTMGFLEELPPEVVSVSLEEDIDSEDDSISEEIISQNENDVVIEDIFERSSTTQRNVSNENIEEEDGAESEGTSDKNGHVVKHEVFQNKDCIDQDMDPKIRKGLKKIQKLDAILADKLQREKDVKTHRRRLEKKWREEISQLDQLREQEGHGKMELGVGHALALGPPTDDNQPDDIESVPVTPLFATQPLSHDHLPSPSDRGISSSCDSWAEQDIDDVESKNSKKSRGRKGSKHSKTKGKEQNFVKRNIELAADAGNMIPMTEAEKKRLEQLLSDETDLLMVENAYSEDGLSLPAGEGFTLDSESVTSLANIDRKLHDLVPEEEMDLLTTEETWKPLRDLDQLSEDASSVKVDADTTGLGERILREEKEMREMKRRLLAIEADLQALYRENGEESTEVTLSGEILQKLIGRSSRTTSRSTTVSERVMSSLSSARTTTDETIKQEEFQLAPTSPAKRSKMKSNSKHSLHTNLFCKENETPCGSNDEEY
ncbi:fibrous sheath-interacting protein 1-like isoform X1 [Porites lutea]